ncbi:Deoxycytidylate deaminase [Frankliniella fusca]|uniref:Probable deoxycytidylate deaminase n=1 Tax=Frankliniella fusca TaxID=407009 RepID=A0AAE1LSD4_9NEOP|nr:Deoxycytidylate deaminase [Frankliniella fusca]
MTDTWTEPSPGNDPFDSKLSQRTKKREDYILWDDYFMSIAFLVSNRSKDPSTQVGACIVNKQNRIVGQGYNGMPRRCRDHEFPWDKTSSNPLETKYFYVCHAEMNAIFNKNCADISNCKIYTVLFPCNQCAKTIIQSGITEVVYMCDKNRNKPEAIASLKMLKAAGVICRKLERKVVGYKIDFNQCVCVECPENKIVRAPRFGDASRARENCLPWKDYFLALSILVAKRSKCPDLQLGACIVNEDNCIVGQGYNGMPMGCSDDAFPWGTESPNPLENKYLYECHAELNAILNAGLKLKGCVMYTMVFPCNECAKAIIQSGIKKVVYLQLPKDDPQIKAAKKMFHAAKVKYRQHKPKQEVVFLDFKSIEN